MEFHRLKPDRPMSFLICNRFRYNRQTPKPWIVCQIPLTRMSRISYPGHYFAAAPKKNRQTETRRRKV